VRTVLRRLEEKGYLRHEVDGRTFVYHATQHRRGVAARAVQQIIDRFCGGSVEQLLVGMRERYFGTESAQATCSKNCPAEGENHDIGFA
jgi:predicted transcriptional regulator